MNSIEKIAKKGKLVSLINRFIFAEKTNDKLDVESAVKKIRHPTK